MTNHPIRRCHCLEVYQRAGEVDGLDMAVSVKSWPPVLVRGLVCSRRHSQESIHLDRNIFNSNISSGSIASVGGIHFFLPPRPKLASHNISFHLNHFFWPNFSSPCVPHLTRTDKFPEKKNSYSRVPGSIGLFGKLTICVMELDTSWCSWGGGAKSLDFTAQPLEMSPLLDEWMTQSAGYTLLISAIPTILFPRHIPSHEEAFLIPLISISLSVRNEEKRGIRVARRVDCDK